MSEFGTTQRAWRRPECPACAATFRYVGRRGGEPGVYDECVRCQDRREAGRAAARGRLGAANSFRDWLQLRTAERGALMAEDMGLEEPFPNPMRRNSDAARRELERRVGDGDLRAALDLVSALLRTGEIPLTAVQLMASRERGRIEAAEQHDDHQGYANYETFNVATTLENDREFYEGWVVPKARGLWHVSSEENRSEVDTSYSMVSIQFGDMIEKAVAGWASEDPIRPLARRNLVDLTEDLEAIGAPWPRDTRLLGELFTSLLRASLNRVQWREIAAHWLHQIVPESHGYRARPEA